MSRQKIHVSAKERAIEAANHLAAGEKRTVFAAELGMIAQDLRIAFCHHPSAPTLAIEPDLPAEELAEGGKGSLETSRRIPHGFAGQSLRRSVVLIKAVSVEQDLAALTGLRDGLGAEPRKQVPRYHSSLTAFQ